MSEIEKYENIEALRTGIKALKAQGHQVAFVPTMGYLHDGHLSLVDIAHKHADKVIVSIFVNPTQFNDLGDLERYPIDIPRDMELLDKKGVSAVFIPTRDMIYGTGYESWVNISELTKGYEGADRPGHFQGVSTVVSILFNLVQPDCAVFGEKDFQQLRIIERMVEDLKYDLKIIRGPLIREADGLALSSRNVLLSEEDRKNALAMSRGLKRASEAFKGGERDGAALKTIASEELANNPKVKINYISLVNEQNLEEIPEAQEQGSRILAAINVGKIRLIDNMALGV